MATYKILPLGHRKLKNGDYPIYLRVIHNRKKKEYSLKLRCNTTNYDFEHNRYKRDKLGNERLAEIEARTIQIINSLYDHFNFYEFENEYFPKRNSSNNSIKDSVATIINNFKSQNRFGTASVYHDSLVAFAKYINIDNISFNEINTKHIQGYKAYLEDKSLSKATISIYLRTIKAAYNKCIIEPKLHPFKGVKIPTGKKGKLALTKSQVYSLYEYQTNDVITRRSIDWFMLSYLCRGMNFSDLINLQYDKNIVDNRIIYQRKKTLRTALDDIYFKINITSTIKSILDNYRSNTDYLLPVLDENVPPKNARERSNRHLKIINKRIKKVAEELGVPNHNKLTYYCARHSYARTLQLSDCSINLISQCLGHSSPQTTLNYLSSIEQDKIDASDALLY